MYPVPTQCLPSAYPVPSQCLPVPTQCVEDENISLSFRMGGGRRGLLPASLCSSHATWRAEVERVADVCHWLRLDRYSTVFRMQAASGQLAHNKWCISLWHELGCMQICCFLPACNAPKQLSNVNASPHWIFCQQLLGAASHLCLVGMCT